MKGRERLRLLGEYLADRGSEFFKYAVVFCIFLLLAWLYHMPNPAYWYALLLAAVVLLVWNVPGFIRYCRCKEALRRMEKRPECRRELLPEPNGTIEAQYQTLLELYACQAELAQNEKASELRELEEYSTMWVHQIKTPIAAMDLILQGMEDTDSQELQTQLFRINQYVEMSLAYVRLRAENQDLRFRRCCLKDAVERSASKLAQLFIRGHVGLELGILETEVVTDEKWICFVLEQLMSNAVKYAPGGLVRVSSDGNTLQIEDNGIGIAPEDLPRVFEKGYTGRNGRIDQRASGIGLYLCNQICEKLGCQLELESKVHQGTRALLTFPEQNARYD